MVLLCSACIGRSREVGRGKWGEEAGRVVAFIIVLDDPLRLWRKGREQDTIESIRFIHN